MRASGKSCDEINSSQPVRILDLPFGENGPCGGIFFVIKIGLGDIVCVPFLHRGNTGQLTRKNSNLMLARLNSSFHTHQAQHPRFSSRKTFCRVIDDECTDFSFGSPARDNQDHNDTF